MPVEHAGQRVDLFVQAHLHRTSRTRAQAIVRASAYDGSGRKLPERPCAPRPAILLWRAPWDETPVPTEIETVYEDEHLLAVDKPARPARAPDGAIPQEYAHQACCGPRPECPFLSLGHRLDRETSGMIIVTKTRACDRALKKALEARDDIEKTYLAITWGVPDRGDGAAEFRLERSMELDLDRLGEGQDEAAATRPTRSTPRRCSQVEETRRSEAGARLRLRALQPGDGRQHQIRVHLASLGAPVVGDKLYGPDERAFARSADGELTAADSEMLELPRHALHAARLSLPHPITGERLTLEAKMPRDMADFWGALR